MLFSQVIDDGRIDKLLEIFNYSDAKSDSLIMDFKNTTELLAPGLAILNCMADHFIEQKKEVQAINLNLSNQISNQIIKIFSGSKSSMLPISQMSFEDKNIIVSGAINALDPLFLDRVDQKFQKILSEEKLWYVRLILNELMQNACDHSTSERYYYYTGVSKKDFLFGVCDMGVTIPSKLEQKYHCDDDILYLLKSLELGVGTRRVRQGGFGLNYVFEVLKEQKGRLVIVSRNAQVRKYFSRRKTETSFLKHRLNGTWCMARIPLTNGL